MFALLVALAVYMSGNLISWLYRISQGKSWVTEPQSAMEWFVVGSVLLAFIIYALLNWV